MVCENLGGDGGGAAAGQETVQLQAPVVVWWPLTREQNLQLVGTEPYLSPTSPILADLALSHS